MKRKPEGVLDKKVGSVIRMRRVKLGMSQSELGKALGVIFQQISEIREWSKRDCIDAHPCSPPDTRNDAERFVWSEWPHGWRGITTKLLGHDDVSEEKNRP
jgi:hypothetical protein